MPLNESSKPYGIITDIIGTGGSSGSPIVAAKTGEVIAIEVHIWQYSIDYVYGYHRLP